METCEYILSKIIEYTPIKSQGIDRKDMNGNTALDLACIRGYETLELYKESQHKNEVSNRYRICNLLIQNGASILLQKRRNSHLHWAIWYNDVHLAHLMFHKDGYHQMLHIND